MINFTSCRKSNILVSFSEFVIFCNWNWIFKRILNSPSIAIYKLPLLTVGLELMTCKCCALLINLLSKFRFLAISLQWVLNSHQDLSKHYFGCVIGWVCLTLIVLHLLLKIRFYGWKLIQFYKYLFNNYLIHCNYWLPNS